jgi:hypothetical protein
MHSFSNCHDGKCLVLRSVQAIVVVAAALLALIVTNRTLADEVTRWNQIATDASTTPNTDPLTETRIFAILYVAIHDAVNAAESRYDPYLQGTSPVSGASAEAAIAGAAYDTLVALLPESKVSYDAAMEETLRTVTDNSRKTAGLQVGRAAAAAILKARENDGANRTVQYNTLLSCEAHEREFLLKSSRARPWGAPEVQGHHPPPIRLVGPVYPGENSDHIYYGGAIG